MSTQNGGSIAGLSRARIGAAALALVQEEGLDSLAMRPLADRLGVKAASLYWHVRDREELLGMLAGILWDAAALPSSRSGWRQAALAVCRGLEELTQGRRDSARILLQAAAAMEAAPPHQTLARILTGAGLARAEAGETATMMLAAVLVASTRSPAPDGPAPGQTLLVAIDSGSRGVTLRAGAGLTDLIQAKHDSSASAPAVFRGERVIVRRLRGGRQGELELNPSQPWRFQVQAPTWNTRLELTGLDVMGIKVDSGAARVECALSPPRGSVPIDISSGVVGVRLRRPPGVAIVADVSAGAVQIKLDGTKIAAAGTDVRWESRPGAAGSDHYHLTIHSGAVRVTIEEDRLLPAVAIRAPADDPGPGGVEAALEVLLDGVAARRRT